MVEPGQRAQTDQVRAAARDLVDALVETALDAYAADEGRPDGPAGAAWARTAIAPLRGIDARELVPLIVECVSRLALAELRTDAAALAVILRIANKQTDES